MQVFRLVAFAALFACTFNLTAQDTTRTLIHLKRPQYLGIYVSPEFQYGQFAGDFTTVGGASAMLILNKKWAIGATRFGITNNSFSPSKLTPQYLNANFGGLKLEYTPRPNSAVHLSFPLVIGAASARQDTTLYRWGGRGDDGFYRGRSNNSQFVMVQPSVQLEANLLRWVKLYAGVNYRLLFDANAVAATNPVAKANVQGFSVNVGLKLGLFDVWVGKKQPVENQPITN